MQLIFNAGLCLLALTLFIQTARPIAHKLLPTHKSSMCDDVGRLEALAERVMRGEKAVFTKALEQAKECVCSENYASRKAALSIFYYLVCKNTAYDEAFAAAMANAYDENEQVKTAALEIFEALFIREHKKSIKAAIKFIAKDIASDNVHKQEVAKRLLERLPAKTRMLLGVILFQ